jgi:methionyl-tRNA formyltransferase
MNKIVFVGAVELSATALHSLRRNDIKPCLVVTLPTYLSYRHSDYHDFHKSSYVEGIPILDVDDINKHVEAIAEYRPDYILVWGWSQLIKKPLLNVPKYGCIGLHPTALPEGRGRGVIPWTILMGQTTTGVSMFYLDEDMDTGDIIQQNMLTLDVHETALTLYKKVQSEIRKMVQIIAPTLKDGKLTGVPQDHSRSTYFAKRTPEDGRIDWKQSDYQIDQLIRATTHPYPGAFTFYKGKKIVIWQSEIVKTTWTGIPGQILTYAEGGKVVVQAGWGQIAIQHVEVDQILYVAADYFTRVHGKFE